MPDSGTTADTSIYRNQNYDPFSFQNKLLDNQLKQQQVQESQLKLAMERFQTINSAASGLLEDPELGKTDIRAKLWDTLARATADDAMTAQHAVEFATKFPSDPNRQYQAIKAVHAQTLDALQRGQAYLGETREVSDPTGTHFYNVPSFGGTPTPQGFQPAGVAPGTQQYGKDNKQTFVGGAGNQPYEPQSNNLQPPVQPQQPQPNRLGVTPPQSLLPPVGRVLPVRPAAAPTSRNFQPPGSIVAAPAPGEIDLAAAPVKRADALQATATSSNQYHADLENLRQESGVMGNLGGPTQDVEKKLNQLSTRVAGFGITMSPDQLRASESFDKIASNIALNQAKMLGGTDSTRSMSVGATPNSGMSRYGRDGVIDMLQGNQDAVDRARKLWLKTRANGAPASSFDLFMDRLSDEIDPRVFQFNRLSRDNQQKFLSQMDPADMKDFEEKYKSAIEKKWVKPLKSANAK